MGRTMDPNYTCPARARVHINDDSEGFIIGEFIR